MTTHPKLTDEAVALLPLESGRAELLEEIMSTEAPERSTVEIAGDRRPRTWLVPIAAAATVAGIAAATVWGQGLLPSGDSDGAGADSAPYAALGLPGDQGLVLDAPGWTVDSLYEGSIRWAKGGADLEVTTYDADSYEDYVVDREHIYDPPAPGEPIEVLGRDAQMWAYSADDHTAIREVEDGTWLEARGSGMDEAAYLALLGQLRFTSNEVFEASLPEDYVTEGGRQSTADEIVAQIQAVSGAGFAGDAPSFAGGEAKDRYQFGAEVVGAYACSWFEAYENAVTHDQTQLAQEAAAVVGTSRDWPILQEMDATGDYPEVIWQISDEIVSGEPRMEGYREGLGC